MKRVFLFIFLVCFSFGFSQSFPTNDTDVFKEVNELKKDDFSLASLLYSYYVNLYDGYSKQRADAYDALESANSYHVGRSTEQKLKDVDNAKAHYNEINNLYQKSLVSCNSYFDYLDKKYPGQVKKRHK